VLSIGGVICVFSPLLLQNVLQDVQDYDSQSNSLSVSTEKTDVSSGNAYRDITEQLPLSNLNDYNYANFLWGDDANHSQEVEDSDDGDERALRHRESSILRRSDPQVRL
jgi:hypothetical protein